VLLGVQLGGMKRSRAPPAFPVLLDLRPRTGCPLPASPIIELFYVCVYRQPTTPFSVSSSASPIPRVPSCVFPFSARSMRRVINLFTRVDIARVARENCISMRESSDLIDHPMQSSLLNYSKVRFFFSKEKEEERKREVSLRIIKKFNGRLKEINYAYESS